MFEKLLFWILLGLIAVCTVRSDDQWIPWQVTSSINTSCTVVRYRDTCTGEYHCSNGREWDYRFCTDPSLFDPWSLWECQTQMQAKECLLHRHRICAAEFLHICDNITAQKDQMDRWTDLKSCPCYNVNTDRNTSYNVTTWSSWNGWECRNLTAHCFFYRTRDNCTSSDIQDCRSADSVQLLSLENGKSCPCAPDGSGLNSTEQATGIDNTTEQCYLTSDHCFLYFSYPCSSADASYCTASKNYIIADLDQNQHCPCKKSAHSDNRWSPWLITSSINTTCAVVRIRDNCTGEYLCNNGREWDYRNCTDPSLFEPWSPWECQSNLLATDCLLKRRRNCASELLHLCDKLTEQTLQIDRWTHFDSCPCNNVNKDLSNNYNVTTWSSWNDWECRNLTAHCFFYRTRNNCSSSDIQNCNSTDSVQLVSLENANSCPCTQDGSGLNSELATGIVNTIWQCYLISDHCFLHFPYPCSSTDASTCTAPNKYIIVDLSSNQQCPCKKSEASINTTGQTELSYPDNWSEWNCQWKDNHCYMYRTRTCSVARESMNCTYSDRVQVSIIDDDEPCPCLPGYQVSTTQPPDVPIVVSWLSWGEWECHGESSSCFMTRFRECTVKSFVFCNTTNTSEFELQNCDEAPCKSLASKSTTVSTKSSMISTSQQLSTTAIPNSTNWGAWGKWFCTKNSGNCTMTRSRTCTKDSCETEEARETRNCTDDVCQAHWKTWSNWLCHTVDRGICLMLRRRNCSSGNYVDCGESQNATELFPCANSVCPEMFSQQLSGKCGAYLESEYKCKDMSQSCASLNSTLDACNNPEIASKVCPRSCRCCDNEMEGLPVWEKWSPWKCKLVPISKCVMYRSRRCSSGNASHCTGQAYDENNCTVDVCPEIYDIKVNCSYADAHNCDESHLQCAPFTSIQSSFRRLCSESVSVSLCPFTCGCCENKTSATSMQPSTLTSSFLSTTGQVTTVGLSPTTTVINITPSQTYTTNIATTTTVTSSSTTLSPTYLPTTREVSSSTEGTITKWRYWYCKTVQNGSCVMYQKKNCPTEQFQECDQTGASINEQACDPHICPDYYKIEKSGKCSKYNSNICEDRGTTCSSLKEDSQACNNPDIAGDPCPKKCGCCDNEKKGIVPWEKWSEWKCVSLLAPYKRCDMSRNRLCASGNLSDCTGEHQEKDECHQDLCHDFVNVTVVCSPKDECVDDPHCSSLSYNLESLCGGHFADSCPVVCGCCCNSTNSTCRQSTTTTVLTTVSSTQVEETITGQNTSPLTTKPDPGVKTSTVASQSNATSTSSSPYEISSLSTTESTKSTTGDSGNLPHLTMSTVSAKTTNQDLASMNTEPVFATSSISKPPEVTSSQLLTSTSTSSFSQSLSSTSSDTPSASTTMSTASSTTSNQGLASMDTEPVFATSSISKPPEVTSSQMVTSTATSSFSQNLSSTSSETPLASTAISTASETTSSQGLASINTEPVFATSSISKPPDVTSSQLLTSKATSSFSQSQSTPIPATSGVTQTSSSPTRVSVSSVSATTTAFSLSSLKSSQASSVNSADNTSAFPVSTQSAPATTISELTEPPATVATTTTTTTAKPPQTTTHKIPYTIPPKTTNCAKCAGPEILCEKLYEVSPCEQPNNYCINKIVNHNDGTRSVTRGCGNFDTCYKDWFLGSSDIDKCRLFDENNFITLKFDCTFCCIKDDCNVPLRPASDTMYKDL